MRSIPSLTAWIFLTFARPALAQVEATFPPAPPPKEGDSTEDAAPDTPPEGAEPAPTESSPPEPGPPTPARESNPYGPPPAPPSSMPGNPYGTVPHRPPTPGTNPYVDSAHAAHRPQPETPVGIEETNWSVGGGLSTETPSALGTGGYQSYYPSLSRFSSSLLFERRLSRALFLLVQPRVLYHKGTEEPLDPDLESTTFEESRLGVEAGTRWVANPGGAVEVGMSHLAYVEYNRFVQDGPFGLLSFGSESAEAEQIAVGLSNAFIAERRLLPHLWLRLGVGLFGLQYYSTKIIAVEEEEDEDTGETTEVERHSRVKGLRAGLSPTLALQVRLSF